MAQHQDEGQQRRIRTGLGDFPHDRELDRYDRELAFVMAEDAAIQRRLLDALCDDRHGGLGHLARRLRDSRRAQEPDAGQYGRRQPDRGCIAPSSKLWPVFPAEWSDAKVARRRVPAVQRFVVGIPDGLCGLSG
jgi:hypothetical protein